MMPEITKQDTELRLDTTIHARPDRVWAAWTDPRHLAGWLSPMPTWGCRVASHEFREGGAYAVEMIEPEGDVHRVEGTYRTIDPPRRLAFTWKWTTEPADAPASLVEVELRPAGEHTHLTLTHTRLAGRASVEEHAQGWIGCIGHLESYLSASGP